MGGTIFISYRRSDDPGFAGRLFDQLERIFRRKALFMDVDSIAPGQDFVSILEARVAECDVLLALIGRNWLTATDEAGRCRLENAEDFVRIEIAMALTQAKRVIPVLIDDVPMPRPEDLPEVLKPLARCQAMRLSHDRFRADSDGLIRALKQILAEAKAPSPAPDGMSGSQEGPLTPTPASTGATKKLSLKAPRERFNAQDLEKVSKDLAFFIGPIGMLHVKEAARKATSIAELYEMVATHIENEQHKAAFLGKAPRRR